MTTNVSISRPESTLSLTSVFDDLEGSELRDISTTLYTTQPNTEELPSLADRQIGVIDTSSMRSFGSESSESVDHEQLPTLTLVPMGGEARPMNTQLIPPSYTNTLPNSVDNEQPPTLTFVPMGGEARPMNTLLIPPRNTLPNSAPALRMGRNEANPNPRNRNVGPVLCGTMPAAIIAIACAIYCCCKASS